MKPTILCVDDEQIVRTSLKEQLKRFFDGEYRIEIADSGEVALELVLEIESEGGEIAVVVADQIMPGLQGDELLVRLHARNPRMRTVLLTGQASADAVGNALNNAALYRYISKPWERDDLNLTLREAARSYFTDRRLDEQNQELRALNEALEVKMTTFFKFVPRDFLRLLGIQDRYEDVGLGMGIDVDLAVLFSDIRSFTTLCEGLSPSECVRFINDYIAHVEVPIGEHGGFVEGFSGDGIMALFDAGEVPSGATGSGADRAVRAAIGMQQALRAFNDVRRSAGLGPVAIGIGVNAGQVTLGTLGGPLRLKCGVAGDPVNLAARVESLTKVYGVKLLITDQTRGRLEDPSRYAMRQVDWVRVRGRTTPVSLFEVLDAEEERDRELKQAHLSQYEAAVTLYYQRQFADAGRLFAECLVANPTDQAALTYMARCGKYSSHELGDDWTGIELMSTK